VWGFPDSAAPAGAAEWRHDPPSPHRGRSARRRADDGHRSCRIDGARARCRAIIRGPRQTLRATVVIRELPHDYVVRVLRIG